MCAIFGIIGKSDRNLLKKISAVQLFRQDINGKKGKFKKNQETFK